MANYYSKQTLQEKVKQLEEATGFKMEIISCNGYASIQVKDGSNLGFVSWYRPIKQLIIYADGFLSGMKYGKQ